MVLMIHGAGGGGWEWNVWRRVFAAAGHAVATPDLQAVVAGVTPTRWQGYLEQVTKDAEALPTPRVLVGASLGGLLALAAANDIACAALVLVNPLPPLPEAASLPLREASPERIPWGRDASLAGTRRALPEAEDAACHYAFRRWRDESGAVLNTARAGIELTAPRCPLLVIASERDEDVPPTLSTAFAQRVGASWLRVAGSHVGPLLGAQAADCAGMAVHWLNSLEEFRTD